MVASRKSNTKYWNGKSKKQSFKPKGKHTRYDAKQNKLIAKVYSLVKPEVKQFFGDTGFITFFDTQPIVFQPLSNIVAGTGAYNRIGDKIKVSNISIKYQLKTYTGNDFIRIATVRNVGTTVLSSSNFLGGTNDYFDKTKIKTYTDVCMPSTPNTANRRGTRTFNFPKGLNVDYTNFDKSQLIFAVMQDMPNTNGSAIQYTYVITFTDA